MSISIACGSDLPVERSSSTALSRHAVSLWFSGITGNSLLILSPRIGDSNMDSRARIQLILPRTVFISPL